MKQFSRWERHAQNSWSSAAPTTSAVVGGAGEPGHACSQEWDWSKKVVVELGCGASALPSCSASLNGPRVVCTDGNASALAITQTNVQRWVRAHAEASTPMVAQLRWGEAHEVSSRPREPRSGRD